MRLTNKKKFNAIFSEIEKKTEAFLNEVNAKVSTPEDGMMSKKVAGINTKLAEVLCMKI